MKVFTGMKLIDGTGQAWEKAVLIIEEGKVVAAGGTVTIPEGAEVVDLTGKTLLPGLIDAHVHLCMDPVADPMTLIMGESDANTTLRAVRNAEITLKNGVTTVRDMGGKNYIDLDIRDAIAKGSISGPRMLVSGKLLCMTGGHGWAMGLEVDSEAEARKGARQQLKRGVDLVKIMATGGVMTPGVEPGSPQLTEEEMRAAIFEANKAGRKTATHAQGTTGIQNAIRAGISSIEHGFYLDEETVEMMIERDVYLVATLAAPYWIVVHGRDAGIPEHAVAKSEMAMEDHSKSFELAYKSGVKIAMGTDSGTPFNEHGKNAFELKMMVDRGMSPMEAILAATKAGSELLGVDREVGTLEPGKQADLLVVDGDPLADITNLSNVYQVYKGGKLVK